MELGEAAVASRGLADGMMLVHSVLSGAAQLAELRRHGPLPRGEPRFSPSGKRLAYLGSGAGASARAVDTHGGVVALRLIEWAARADGALEGGGGALIVLGLLTLGWAKRRESAENAAAGRAAAGDASDIGLARRAEPGRTPKSRSERSI